MFRSSPFISGEVYHVYNRGAHKAKIFLDNKDYFRLKILLFLGNDTNSLRLSNTLRTYREQGPTLLRLFEEEKPDQELVEVLSYALMPNHFHLIVRQKTENGISLFMKKVATAYSMYFNTYYEHSGTVFQGRFKSKHVDTGEYLRWLFAYVALNPLDIKFPNWKERGVGSRLAYNFLASYQQASFPDLCAHQNAARPEKTILALEALKELGEDVPNFSNVSTLLKIEQTQP